MLCHAAAWLAAPRHRNSRICCVHCAGRCSPEKRRSHFRYHHAHYKVNFHLHNGTLRSGYHGVFTGRPSAPGRVRPGGCEKGFHRGKCSKCFLTSRTLLPQRYTKRLAHLLFCLLLFLVCFYNQVINRLSFE